MGAVHSTRTQTRATSKTVRHYSKRHRPSHSLDDLFKFQSPEGLSDGEAVVLEEQDFKESNLGALIERRPEIRRVRLGVDAKRKGKERWIPTDVDLTRLKEMHSLEALDLTGCSGITRNGLARFTLNPARIKELVLDDCFRISNNFFDYIVHFAKLEKLHLRGCCRISDIGIEALRSLKNLRHLDLSLCATEQAAKLCQQCENPTITDAALRTLSHMTLLKSLQLERCSNLTNDGLQYLATLRNLTCLNIGKTALTDEGLRLLRQFSGLLSLNVSGCEISEDELMRQLKQSGQLRRLDVADIRSISDSFTQYIAKQFRLTHLNLSGCDGISARGFQHLAKHRTLTHLTANRCPGFTASALASLSALTQLQQLHISSLVEPRYEALLPFAKLRQLEITVHSADDPQLSKLAALSHLTDLKIHVDGTPSRGVEEPICLSVLGIRVHLIGHAAT